MRTEKEVLKAIHDTEKEIQEIKAENDIILSNPNKTEHDIQDHKWNNAIISQKRKYQEALMWVLDVK